VDPLDSVDPVDLDHAHVERWVARYETAWRQAGTDALFDLFTPDATYRPSPWSAPIGGSEELAAFWEAERDGPDEQFNLRREIVAVDSTTATAVVRLAVDYADGESWRDLWIVTFAPDGRCTTFEEWPFAPTQPDGH
jgi:ketosteroid isomerase-like protein